MQASEQPIETRPAVRLVASKAALAVGEPILHPSWAAAWTAVLDSLNEPGFVLVTGEPGTGKTLFLETLEGVLNRSGRDARLLRRGAQMGPGRPQVLLIDQADRLPDPVLQALARQKHACVLAGTPALPGRFPASAELMVVQLARLAPSDAGDFVATHLQQAGHPADLLHPDAKTALVQHGGGVPQTLLTLTDFAVFMARLEDAPQVRSDHVIAAAQVQDGTRLDHDDLLDYDDLLGDEPIGPTPQPAPAPVPARPKSRHWQGIAVAAITVAAGLTPFVTRQPLAPGPQVVAAVEQPQPVRPRPPEPAAVAQPAPAQVPSPVPASREARTTAQPSPAALAALPASAPVRVTIAYQRGDKAGERRSADVARRLRAAGLDAGDPEPGGVGPNDPVVGYFFPEDTGVAADVARHADLGPARLLPARGALPRPGTIRITIPDSSVKPRRADITLGTASNT